MSDSSREAFEQYKLSYKYSDLFIKSKAEETLSEILYKAGWQAAKQDSAKTIAELQAQVEALRSKLSNIVDVSETLCSLIDDITISNQTNSIKAKELYRWQNKLDSIVTQYNSDAAIKGGE